MLKFRIILSIILFLSFSPVYARWASVADANVDMQICNNDITIHADGTTEEIVEWQYKLLNENGRMSYSILPLYYNHDNSKLEIISAKTIVDGHEYILGADLIEDKPVASASLQGFDQQNQVVLAFPNTKVDAVIYVKFKQTILKPDLSGFYETLLHYGHERIINSVTRLKSEVPLYINYNDPDNYLDIKKSKAGKLNTITVTLKKPVFIKIADEHHNLISPQKSAWIFVTTNDNWDDFANKIADPFMQVMQQPLPELYQQIANTAKAESDPIKRINIIMSMLNDAVKYMGDWKTSKGRHIPKDLELVAKQRLGDCKDFSTGTAAILNSLGIKSTVALVQRGEGVYDVSYLKLPGFNNFNHAMVKVELGNRILWIDPTNYSLIADKILPDIADRQVLVLASKKSKREHIPNSHISDKKVVNIRELELNKPALVPVKGTMSLQGLGAVAFTGSELYWSKDSIEFYVLSNQGSFQNMIDKKVIVPNLKSRIVSDLNFEYEFKEKNRTQNTNAGKGMVIANNFANNYIFSDEQVSDVYIGAPGIVSNKVVLSNIKPVNTLPLDCTIESPWVDAKRVVIYQKNSITVTEEFKIKKSWIYNEEIKSATYKKLADDLALNFKDGIGIVFTE
jgi:hypothetical protein